MWARVKGQTENELLALFNSAYMVRLGALRSMHDEAPRARWARNLYAILSPLLPLVRAIAPGAVEPSRA